MTNPSTQSASTSGPQTPIVGPEYAPAQPLDSLNFAYAGFALVLLLIALVLSVNLPVLGFPTFVWIPSGLFLLSLFAALCAVVRGSERAIDMKVSGFKIIVAVALAVPVPVATALLATQFALPAPQYIAIFSGAALLSVAFLAALLKSNVSGERRDALQLGAVLAAFLSAVLAFLEVLTLG